MLALRLSTFAWSLAVPVLLRTAGIEATRRLMRPRRVRPAPLGEVLAAVSFVDRRPWRWPLRPRCLCRALVLGRALLVTGHPVEVVIGFRRARPLRGTGTPRLEGHAWIEMGGAPLAEPANLAAYEEVTRLGPGDIVGVSR